MPENPMNTAARKIAALERDLRRLNTIQTGYTIGDVNGTVLSFPELRGYWPFSSVDQSGNAFDLSGNGRLLSNNGTVPRTTLATGIPYCTFNGSTQYFSRADEAGLDITGALTLGGWFWITDNPAQRDLITKWNSSGVSQRAYALDIQITTGTLQIAVSADGAASKTLESAVGIATGAWHFLAGRFIPSTSVSVYYDGTVETNTTSVPASIFNSSATLVIGGRNTSTASLAGRAALPFVCASALSDTLLSRLYGMSRAFFGV